MRINQRELEKAIEKSLLERSEIAKKIGCTTQAVGTWINGTAMPKKSNVRKLAKALKMKPEKLTTIEER